MNLIFEIGNTTNKLAVYNKQQKVISLKSKEFTCEEIQEKIASYNIEKGIICSVKNLPEYIFDLICVNMPKVHILSHKSKLPFNNEYETPRTLGPDRLAAIAGAYLYFRGEKVLIIDAGSAITYDFLSGNNYKGGNISPGLSMRFKALHKFTSKLPLVSISQYYSNPAKNTIEALRAGVITGVTYEINEYIRTFVKKYKGIKVVITGGDAEFLTSRIIAKTLYMPDLVIEGLNYILEYNV